MKILVVAAAVIAVLVVFLIGYYQTTPQANTTGECNNDSDCFIGGCSGQICSNNPDVITTCEYRDYYACYQLTSCGCTDHKCGWKSTSEFNSCMSQKGTKVL